MHINAPVPRLMLWRPTSEEERSPHQSDAALQPTWQVPPGSPFIKSPALHQFPSSQSDFLPPNYQPVRPSFHEQTWPAPSTISSSSTSPEPCTQQRGQKRQREESCQPYRPHYSIGLVHHQGYQPLSALRTTQQQNRAKSCRLAFQGQQSQHQQQARRAMYGADEWGFMEGMDGDVDSYEIRPLQNELPSGTASSPFSRPDGPAMTLPGRDQLASPREPYYFDFVNGTNDGFPGLTAEYISSGLSDMHSIPDLSMFSPGFGMPPSMIPGMPIQGGAGMYAAGMGCANTAPGAAYGSFPSSSSGMVPYGGSSFGSVTRGGNGEDGVNTAGQLYSANGGYIGVHSNAGFWSAAASESSRTMSPQDISFKPDPSPVPSPPSLLPLHHSDEEHQLPACKSEAVTSAPADRSPSKKQRKSSGGSSSSTKTRKSLPDKAPRHRKAPPPKKQEPLKLEKTTPSKPPSRRTSSKTKQEPTPQKTLTSLLPAPSPKHPHVSHAEHVRAIVAPRRLPTDARAPSLPRRPAPHASRAEKNEYLLACRARGITYSEIRAAGGFTEAESTLRGKVRALTKSKEERVRKPQWTDKDVELLLEGVHAYAADGGARGAFKVPWKLVAEFIHENGGTYRFGYATCRKKWDELMEEEDGEEEDGEEEENE